MLFTLSMPSSNVGGRTTYAYDNSTLCFVISENIQEIIKKIFPLWATIDIPLIKSFNPLHLLAAVGQNGKSVLTSGKKFSKV